MISDTIHMSTDSQLRFQRIFSATRARTARYCPAVSPIYRKMFFSEMRSVISCPFPYHSAGGMRKAAVRKASAMPSAVKNHTA